MCTEQSKNNIVLELLMIFVDNRVFGEINWCFIAFGHTKFNPDMLFGMMRTLPVNATYTSLNKIRNGIKKSKES